MKIIQLLLLIVSFQISTACSCIGTRTVREAIKNNDVVFTGEVLGSEEMIDSSDSDWRYIKYIKYSILIKTVYKGKEIQDTAMVITGMGGGDCGFEFKVGENYIIYGYYKTEYYHGHDLGDEYITTNICTRTTIYSLAEIIEIEKYRKPKNV